MAKTKYHVTFFFSQYTFDYISSNIRPSQLESSGHENYGEAKKIKGSIPRNIPYPPPKKKKKKKKGVDMYQPFQNLFPPRRKKMIR